MVNEVSDRRIMMLCLWLAILLFSTGLAVDVRGEQQQDYGMTRYHEVHLKVGLHCDYCHVNPYKPVEWVKVNNLGVLISTASTNSKREVDKEKCLECHRWGQKAWYSSEPAEAGSFYKK
ncbi:MAG: hypothetical protein ACK4Z9_05020 [Thermodesulfovibrionales bacterium]